MPSLPTCVSSTGRDYVAGNQSSDFSSWKEPRPVCVSLIGGDSVARNQSSNSSNRRCLGRSARQGFLSPRRPSQGSLRCCEAPSLLLIWRQRKAPRRLLYLATLRPSPMQRRTAAAQEAAGKAPLHQRRAEAPRRGRCGTRSAALACPMWCKTTTDQMDAAILKTLVLKLKPCPIASLLQSNTRHSSFFIPRKEGGRNGAMAGKGARTSRLTPSPRRTPRVRCGACEPPPPDDDGRPLLLPLWRFDDSQP